MRIHRLLADGLTGMLGAPEQAGERHVWHLGDGLNAVNVVLDLPEAGKGTRIWIFDPRLESPDCARELVVEDDAAIADALAVIAGIPPPKPASGIFTKVQPT